DAMRHFGGRTQLGHGECSSVRRRILTAETAEVAEAGENSRPQSAVRRPRRLISLALKLRSGDGNCVYPIVKRKCETVGARGTVTRAGSPPPYPVTRYTVRIALCAVRS